MLGTRGDLQAAESMFRRALEIKKKLGNPEGMAKAYCNLGILLQKRGDLKAAEDMLRTAVEIEERLGLSVDVAKTYNSLGTVFCSDGHLDAAEEMHRKALDINEKVGLLEGQAISLNGLGLVLKMRGDLERAEEMIWAEADLPGQLSERQSRVRMAINHPHGLTDTGLGVQGQSSPPWRHARRKLHSALSEGQGELLPRYVSDITSARSRARDQRRQRTQGRQSGRFEAHVTSTRSRIGRQPLEVVRFIPERHASITLAVLMRTLEPVPVIAEHQ